MPYLNKDDFAAVHEALKSGLAFFGGADSGELEKAIAMMDAAVESVASPALRDLAESIYGSDDIEIDDDGVGTSQGGRGAFVQAWVFVPQADIDVTEPDEDDDKPVECRTVDCTGDPDNGEGWNGFCGNCADRSDAEVDAAADLFEDRGPIAQRGHTIPKSHRGEGHNFID